MDTYYNQQVRYSQVGIAGDVLYRCNCVRAVRNTMICQCGFAQLDPAEVDCISGLVGR